MIALIDVVDVLKAQKDSWGINAGSSVATTYEARVFTYNKFETLTLADGKTITPEARIYFGGLVHILGTDKIRYVDDFGVTQLFLVQSVQVIKDFNGVPMFTKVVV